MFRIGCPRIRQSGTTSTVVVALLRNAYAVVDFVLEQRSMSNYAEARFFFTVCTTASEWRTERLYLDNLPFY